MLPVVNAAGSETDGFEAATRVSCTGDEAYAMEFASAGTEGRSCCTARLCL